MKKIVVIWGAILFFVAFSIPLTGCMKSEEKTPSEQQQKESAPAATIGTTPAPKAATPEPTAITKPPADKKKKSQVQPPKKSTFTQKPVLEDATDKITHKSSKDKESSEDAKAGETGRDGRFISYDNGTVLDTRTNLMWTAKDNESDINWEDARSYCKNYRVGGYTDWRMPTQDELAGLYDAAKTYKSACGEYIHLTQAIRLTCYWVWASETSGSDAASFDFYGGFRYSYPQSYGKVTRVLPVRTVK